MTAAADLLAEAAELYRRAPGPPDYEAIWAVLRPIRGFGRAAFDEAIGGLQSPDRSQRAAAGAALRELCDPDVEGWSAEAATALLAVGHTETDPAVLGSLARALGRTSDERALPFLARLAVHPDADVRLRVACALPWCGDDADTLMRLMEDEDDQVRDWATFGLGQLTTVDSPAIRDALVRRLADTDAVVVEEATVGLARRRDRRALAVVLAQLSADTVGPSSVEAAMYLADPRLLGPIRAARARWDLDAQTLDEAVAACDPACQAAAVAVGTALLAALEARGVEGAISIGLCELDATLTVGDDLNRCWAVDNLVASCGGDVEAAADAVAAHLRR